MFVVIVDRETTLVQYLYDAPAPAQSSFGGPFGWTDHTVHLEVPDDLHLPITTIRNVQPSNLKASQDKKGNWKVTLK